ncbi:uncharacterized protein HMPREF1541_05249 [Cyphellophora europaea CBS 101466]|uniref:Major facilitator superfamily (MFS) profile domain-containing protein n=1 Tax=Cyphellophora europaea (strain CBS 101466) TaxID=1220924 RepID=W2RZ74_CYPE1|nr:uncharacterized protein HMPREF1541_05249 [Cyphellophora europaea CBS 101466]ETN40969.1 hypothetical protein HMPREF1541_05249 [Cyphellophora europaea CBS 101466]
MADEAPPPRSTAIKGRLLHDYRAFLYCGVACLGGFQLGLDLGAVAGFQAMPGFLMIFGFPTDTSALGWGIDPTVQQLISSLMLVGSFVACLAVGPMGKYLSRKWVLFIGCCVNHVSVILMLVAKDPGTLYAGRIIIGISVGILDVLPQLYIHESAPANQRGMLLGGFNVFVSIGLLIGSIVDNYTSKIMSPKSYQIPLGIFFIVPVILSIALPFMPESPRWLIEHNRTSDARKALTKLRHKDTSAQFLEAELQEMIVAFETEKSLTGNVALFDCFRRTNLRRTLLSVAIMTCLTGSGAVFVLVYGTYFFAIAGQTNAFEQSVGMTAAGLGATIFSMWLITRIGRRSILMIGFAAQSVCMLIVAAVFQKLSTSPIGGRVLVSFTIIYLFFYNMCVAPYLYLCAGEIPTQRLRGYTLGIAIGVSFLWNWVATFTAPYFLNPMELNWSGKYGYIWLGSNLVILVFVFFFVPETKDRTLEEIDEMFEDKVKARQFKRYNCVRAENARAVAMQDVENKQRETSEHVESI